MITKGWYRFAQGYPSPHFSRRSQPVDLLVIHNISLPPGVFQNTYVHDLFLNKLDPFLHPYFQKILSLKVSAHCFIQRDGMISQFVSFDNAAWHAGISEFEGKQKCNDFSIGIELEGTDDHPFSPMQYKSLAKLTKHILQSYPLINQRRIIGHSDIAPQRKTDPGPFFDWKTYFDMIS